jgi:hypothetical protein
MDEAPPRQRAGMPAVDDSGERRDSGRTGSRPRTATEILRFLPPDLRVTLASLHGAPESVATATVQLLPFGSRAALETLDPPLARQGRVVNEHGRRNLVLTRFCYEVMAAAANAEQEAAVEPDWDQRAARAAATIRSRTHH